MDLLLQLHYKIFFVANMFLLQKKPTFYYIIIMEKCHICCSICIYVCIVLLYICVCVSYIIKINQVAVEILLLIFIISRTFSLKRPWLPYLFLTKILFLVRTILFDSNKILLSQLKKLIPNSNKCLKCGGHH